MVLPKLSTYNSFRAPLEKKYIISSSSSKLKFNLVVEVSFLLRTLQVNWSVINICIVNYSNFAVNKNIIVQVSIQFFYILKFTIIQNILCPFIL